MLVISANWLPFCQEAQQYERRCALHEGVLKSWYFSGRITLSEPRQGLHIYRLKHKHFGALSIVILYHYTSRNPSPGRGCLLLVWLALVGGSLFCAPSSSTTRIGCLRYQILPLSFSLSSVAPCSHVRCSSFTTRSSQTIKRLILDLPLLQIAMWENGLSSCIHSPLAREWTLSFCVMPLSVSCFICLTLFCMNFMFHDAKFSMKKKNSVWIFGGGKKCSKKPLTRQKYFLLYRNR